MEVLETTVSAVWYVTIFFLGLFLPPTILLLIKRVCVSVHDGPKRYCRRSCWCERVHALVCEWFMLPLSFLVVQ